ncbi:MAG: DUF927 domain-containing protein [Thermodesulfovibrio sp.]|nr:DUF927 domain-containing protein [Thermodesulfovibrio sp.]MDW7972440.1 DUF927 domain-containing protein [Thermodesulfovibrio sp.]
MSDVSIISYPPILELKGYLEKIKKAQEDGNIAIFFDSFIKTLRENFYVIPTRQKKPVVKFQSDDDKIQANKAKIDTEAALVLPNQLVVIDIDDPKKFASEFEISVDKIEKIATVKTGKGFHIYIHDEKNELKPFKNEIYELIKGNNELIILPGSRIYHEKLQKNVIYRVLNPTIYTKDELIAKNEKFQRVFKALESPTKRISDETHIKHHTAIEKTPRIDFGRLREIITPHYTEGQRQNLILYLSGFLAKEGVELTDAIEFISSIISEMNDTEKKMRIAAVIETYEKFKSEKDIKGYEGLIEIGISPDDLNSCILQKKEKTPDGFYTDGNLLFFVVVKKDEKTKKEKIEKILIGPALRFNHILYNLEEQKRQVYVQFDRFIYTDLKYEKEYIENITKIPILNPKLFREYIAQEIERLEKEKIYKYVINRTGWFSDNSNVFVMPHLSYDNIFVEHPEQKRFFEKDKQKQHELVKFSLYNATGLGILYVCSVASIFLKDLGTRGFSIFITGPAGVGKTTTCKLACNLFYDCNQEIDLHSTKTAKERILYSFRDLPFLLNEAATSRDEFIQELIFMLESGQTKKRSNIKLSYYFQQIRNVLFLTSERELKVDRLGAERRKIQLTLSEPPPLSLKVQEALKCVGAGVDFINFYVLNKNELMKIKDELEKDITQYYQLPILFSLSFLETFYSQKFEKLREKIQEWFLSQVDTTDYFSYCLERLENFIASNISKFYAPELNYRIINFIKEPVIPATLFGS